MLYDKKNFHLNAHLIKKRRKPYKKTCGNNFAGLCQNILYIANYKTMTLI